MCGLSRPAFVERGLLSVFRVSQAAGFSGARFLRRGFSRRGFLGGWGGVSRRTGLAAAAACRCWWFSGVVTRDGVCGGAEFLDGPGVTACGDWVCRGLGLSGTGLSGTGFAAGLGLAGRALDEP